MGGGVFWMDCGVFWDGLWGSLGWVVGFLGKLEGDSGNVCDRNILYIYIIFKKEKNYYFKNFYKMEIVNFFNLYYKDNVILI